MYEQEILRCYNKHQRELNSLSTPFSFSNIIKDQEVYSFYTYGNNANPSEQGGQSDNDGSITGVHIRLEEKFLKLKDDLIKRQLNESDSLYAVQRMDWQSKIKHLANVKLVSMKYDDSHVPIVIVDNKLKLTFAYLA